MASKLVCMLPSVSLVLKVNSRKSQNIVKTASVRKFLFWVVIRNTRFFWGRVRQEKNTGNFLSGFGVNGSRSIFLFWVMFDLREMKRERWFECWAKTFLVRVFFINVPTLTVTRRKAWTGFLLCISGGSLLEATCPLQRDSKELAEIEILNGQFKKSRQIRAEAKRRRRRRGRVQRRSSSDGGPAAPPFQATRRSPPAGASSSRGLVQGMDLATKGISWAESIFHKCEDIYRDGIMAKEPGKIVDVVGEQLRKIYEEVTDDLLNPFSFVDDSIPKDDHQKLMSSSDGKLMDDDPPTTSSSSSSSLSLSSLPSSSSSSPSSATCSGGQSIVESSGLCRDVFDKNDELTQVGIISSEVNVHTEEITSASTLKVLKSFDPNNLESKEFRQTHTAILTEEEDEKENGRDEEFDDVGLEDFHERKKHLDELEEADSCELALISQRAMKNHSYKKKLRDMLASNFYSARKKWGSRLGGASDTMIEERSMRGASATAIQGISTARGLSVQRPSSSESDWELV